MIAVAEIAVQITFAANFPHFLYFRPRATAFISCHTTLFFILICQVSQECVAKIDSIYDIHFELRYFDSIQKAGPNGISTHVLMLTEHTL